ncbi:crossover junction endodeoxyribonuclease RuvC [Geomicrobium sp. JCM 19055]|uniref:crossover junction endodeoxyribonuclease RuvC n=1 Tax=Geomicrobium sp. JCM 19055 TaxID=1460649 RepID=UPI0022368E03|nr:crossover junction endodeoxyribonuclease RuvC [Geomicrobium sp. JCM 19055]
MEFDTVSAEETQMYIKHLSHVKTNNKKVHGHRFTQISDHLQEIVDEYPPNYVVFEKGFSKFHNVTHTLQRVVGVAIHKLYENEVDTIVEITPTTVKKAITGNGKAKKDQVARDLKNFVGDIEYKTDDESDAVAVALTFALQKGWI